jgi:hypothetical protein
VTVSRTAPHFAQAFLLIGACEVIPGKALSTGTSLTLPRWGGDFMVYGDAPGSISW